MPRRGDIVTVGILMNYVHYLHYAKILIRKAKNAEGH